MNVYLIRVTNTWNAYHRINDCYRYRVAAHESTEDSRETRIVVPWSANVVLVC